MLSAGSKTVDLRRVLHAKACCSSRLTRRLPIKRMNQLLLNVSESTWFIHCGLCEGQIKMLNA